MPILYRKSFDVGTVPMVAIDLISVPAMLLDEVKEQARALQRVLYIGVVTAPNPNYNDALDTEFLSMFRPLPVLGSNFSRECLTGEFVVADDRESITEAGCGYLVGVTRNAA